MNVFTQTSQHQDGLRVAFEGTVTLVELVAEGGGPLEVVAEGGGPLELVAEGGGPLEVVAEGGGPLEVVAEGMQWTT